MYRLSRQCKLCQKNKECLGQFRIKKKWLQQQKSTVNTELAAGYVPHQVENTEIDENYFSSKAKSFEKPFSLILPPPNITGTLHLGHALTVFIQDVLVKWHKMQGRDTIWIPGVDHAGIATQVVVEKKIWNESRLTRHDIGRDKFEQEIWKWKANNSTTIVNQLRRLNVSLNWDKEVFTMDAQRSKAVTEAFVTLFDLGLIYRAGHLVNWSCVLQSAISDVEVDHVTVNGATDLTVPGYDKPVKFGVLTKFAYKLDGLSDEEIVVATTRPETILGDVAVAVNPKDTRYANFIGKLLRHPFTNDVIPVIADDFVDPNFGTGAVKLTPAHDPVDFETAKRHNLEPRQVIDEKGFLTPDCGDFQGIRRFDARSVILSQLADRQLFRGNQEHSMIVPICSRSKDIVEFLIRPQWFLKCSKMAERAVLDVKEGRLKIEPQNFEKVWFQWLENIRDWCISRQLWWGHRIPAYSCSKRGAAKQIWVAAENKTLAIAKAANAFGCGATEIEIFQDEDVLDTWFSSGLHPLSVFGWPDSTLDLDKYYPLSLMETGHDIIFFWVARMVMLNSQLNGSLPFNKILLHGIICDVHGRKMSKSLGNVIAPDDVINGSTLQELKDVLEKNYASGMLSKDELKKALQGQQKMFPNGIPECGADALRFTLLSHNVKYHVINFDVSECHSNRLFCNKIWQATKFALIWYNKVSEAQSAKNFALHEENIDELTPMDKWILSRLTFMIKSVNTALANYNFHVATSSIKDFLYFEFCDIYLESIKSNLRDLTSYPVSKGHCRTLLTSLDLSFRALAPFMPVLAQKLHQSLPRIWKIGESTAFPKDFDLRCESLEKNVEEITELVVGIRRLKKIFNVSFKHNPEVFLIPKNRDLVQEFSQVIRDLSGLHTLYILNKNDLEPQKQGLVKDSVGDTTVFLFVPEELRASLELDFAKMGEKKEKLGRELEKMIRMVSGNGYKEKATMKAQGSHTKKIASLKEKISRIDYIQSLSK